MEEIVTFYANKGEKLKAFVSIVLYVAFAVVFLNYGIANKAVFVSFSILICYVVFGSIKKFIELLKKPILVLSPEGVNLIQENIFIYWEGIHAFQQKGFLFKTWLFIDVKKNYPFMKSLSFFKRISIGFKFIIGNNPLKLLMNQFQGQEDENIELIQRYFKRMNLKGEM